MLAPPVTIREVAAGDETIVPGLVAVLHDVVDGGNSLGFLSPLSDQTAITYWTSIVGQLGPGLRLWVAEDEGAAVGSVQLAPSLKDNGRHRGEIQKLLVRSSHRGRGIASMLLATAEGAARSAGLTLLVLDTQTGSIAERLYARRGYLRVGEIPLFAASPNGELHSTTYYYKPLG